MPFLTLDPLGAQRVVEGSLVRKDAIYQGGRERMRAGNVISTESSPMRVWEFTVVWLTQADEDLTRAAYPRGVPANLHDEVGAPMLGLVDFGETEFVPMREPDGSKTVYRRCRVHIEETVAV